MPPGRPTLRVHYQAIRFALPRGPIVVEYLWKKGYSRPPQNLPLDRGRPIAAPEICVKHDAPFTEQARRDTKA